MRSIARLALLATCVALVAACGSPFDSDSPEQIERLQSLDRLLGHPDLKAQDNYSCLAAAYENSVLDGGAEDPEFAAAIREGEGAYRALAKGVAAAVNGTAEYDSIVALARNYEAAWSSFDAVSPPQAAFFHPGYVTCKVQLEILAPYPLDILEGRHQIPEDFGDLEQFLDSQGVDRTAAAPGKDASIDVANTDNTGEQSRSIVVQLLDDGSIKLEGRTVALENLGAALTIYTGARPTDEPHPEPTQHGTGTVRTGQPTWTVTATILASEDVSNMTLVAVMEELRKAGVVAVRLAP